jgi:hypothetical protein
MLDSDVSVGWVTSLGQVMVKDYWISVRLLKIMYKHHLTLHFRAGQIAMLSQKWEFVPTNNHLRELMDKIIYWNSMVNIFSLTSFDQRK